LSVLTDKQRDRETERQRDRETERQRDRETERQRDRETERNREKQRDGLKISLCFRLHGSYEALKYGSSLDG
jgi:hypothetical protein